MTLTGVEFTGTLVVQSEAQKSTLFHKASRKVPSDLWSKRLLPVDGMFSNEKSNRPGAEFFTCEPSLFLRMVVRL